MRHQIPPKNLTTQRLKLRPFQLDDKNEMFENWCKDDRVTETLSFQTHQSVEDTLNVLNQWVDRYQKGPYYHWAIVYQNQVIGSIGQVDFEPEHERIEIGYCIGFDYWHQGIMTEALIAVKNHLFDEIGIHKIVITHASDNMASGRVMQKAGFDLEGILKENRKNKKGVFIDMYQYGLINKNKLH
jgi:[ribosomal protein S5]-alanine N-acetyltransferase